MQAYILAVIVKCDVAHGDLKSGSQLRQAEFTDNGEGGKKIPLKQNLLFKKGIFLLFICDVLIFACYMLFSSFSIEIVLLLTILIRTTQEKNPYKSSLTCGDQDAVHYGRDRGCLPLDLTRRQGISEHNINLQGCMPHVHINHPRSMFQLLISFHYS